MQARRAYRLVAKGWPWLLVAGALLAGCSKSPSRPPAHTAAGESPETARVQLLGFNDFHGQLRQGRRVAGRTVGGAAVLAAYLRAQQASFAGDSVIIHAGDLVGASPPESALLQDEPTISFLNLLANEHCRAADAPDPACNVVGTVGNHELDEGVAELQRLIYGGNHAHGPFLEQAWRGARFPYVSANMVELATGKPLLPPYVIVQASGVRIGVIGAVLQDTATVVVPSGVEALRFLPEAQAINDAVRALREQGVQAIVVTIHQGAEQASYEGPTREDVGGPGGVIAEIVRELDDAVDVVISGHAHAFSNGYLRTAGGQQVLVTQALSAGAAYAAIELRVDRSSGEVLQKSARVITTYEDAAPGDQPAADVTALVQKAIAATAPRVNRVVGEAAEPIECSVPSASGELALGNLIADAQRARAQVEIAFMNDGGIRADLDAGPITWGELFSIQPFGNTLITMNLTGAQVRAVLEQQFAGAIARLQISGLRYTFREAAPAGAHVVQVTVNGAALDPARVYRVVVNSFLAGGGGGYRIFTEGRERRGGEVDVDALAAYVERAAKPLRVTVDGRIQRLQ